MKVLIGLLCVAVYVAASSLEKRLGVPLSAEDDCNPNIGALNFSTDPINCQVFYICDHGWPKITFCPGDTIWTPSIERCEAPHLAVNDECGFVPPPPPTDPPAFLVDPASCFDMNARCDGIINCEDGSDEAGCAEECNEQNCRPPDCRCSDPNIIPGNLRIEDMPQFVLIGWDEAVRIEDYNHLIQQILKKVTANRRREPRTNPNGCPYVATFFTSHQFTDYAAVQSLYKEGNEFAAHSISKTLPAEFWRDEADYVAEYADQRMMFNTFAGIPMNEIRGIRAAYLQTNGDDMIDFMAANGFEWGSSYPTDKIDPPLFPFTWDKRSTHGCAISPCPVMPHEGVWEVPLVDLYDTNDTLCANVDSCYFPLDKAEALELLRTNFDRHYLTNKAPYTLNLRARWFYNNGYHNLEALQEFLTELEGRPDIYFVTYSQVVEWMKNPVGVSGLQRSGIVDCDYSNRAPLCDHPSLCGYFNITYQPNDEENPGDRFFQTCFDCPDVYPWVGNPRGQ